MTEHRWSKFWWADYEADDALRLTSLAAQGLWMRMLCAMHKGTPYGHLAVNGTAPSNRQMSIMLSATEKEVAKLIPELESAGVLSRTEAGLIYSRRMVRDKAASDEGSANGKRGGNPILKGKRDEGLTPPLNPKPPETLKLEAEAEEEAERKILKPLPLPREADAAGVETAKPERWAGHDPHPSAVTARVGQVVAKLEGRARGQPFQTAPPPQRTVAEQRAAVTPPKPAKVLPDAIVTQLRTKAGIG